MHTLIVCVMSTFGIKIFSHLVWLSARAFVDKIFMIIFLLDNGNAFGCHISIQLLLYCYIKSNYNRLLISSNVIATTDSFYYNHSNSCSYSLIGYCYDQRCKIVGSGKICLGT